MSNDNIIFAYTWDNAIEDGTFVRIPENLSKEAGFKYPMAVTSNLYNSHIATAKPPQSINGRLWDVLNMLRMNLKSDSMIEFTVKLGTKVVKLWATCEGRSPDNPEPVITIMLPEDY